ncbi:SNF2-related protein [Vibrio mediterranei]|uniref:SNF2-related protein n=1 Tax=Vibrio mediterranei TaxID=689 RepID=UPI00406796CB
MEQASLHFDNGTWTIENAPPHVAIKLKSIFPKIPKFSTGPFYLRDTLDIARDLLWFHSRYEFEVSDADKRRLQASTRKYKAELAKAEEITSAIYIPRDRVGLHEGQSLRLYQKATLDLIEHVKTLVVVHDVGLGKSYTALGMALLEGARPLLLVCEPHLQKQFAEKAEEFIDLTVHTLKGSKPYTIPPADIVIAKYNQLAPWVDVLCNGFASIAFDECQSLRRADQSAKGIAATIIAKKIPIRAGFTATPVVNGGIEMFRIANIIRPNCLGSETDFVREWCEGDKGIVRDPDSLGSYLTEINLMHRLTKKDVGQEAKQIQPNIVYVEPDTEQVFEASKLAEQLAIKTLSGDFQTSGQASREFDLALRQSTGIAKAKQVAAYVRLYLESGKNVILYAWHRRCYEIYAEELAEFDPIFYTGTESIAQKEAAKRKFCTDDGKAKVLVMSILSGSGTDGLQRHCSTIVFGELAYSETHHHQAIGRLERDGQTEEVFTTYVVSNFGSDPSMIDLLGLKKNQSRGITDPYKEAAIKQTSGSRIRTMALDYLKQRGLEAPTREQASVSEMSNEELAAFL